MPARRPSHVTEGRINGVTIYRVDHPETGCSAGFWAARVRSRPLTSSPSAALPRETRIELDFQHAAPGRCGCAGRDTDAPAVRALLEVALSLAEVVGNQAAAVLVFLKRVLRLPALGDAELDLWDEVYWPCSEADGEYGGYGDGKHEDAMDGGKVKRGKNKGAESRSGRCRDALGLCVSALKRPFGLLG
ncbi:hypothetical protein DL764_007134 [Monosporascus ibericus]|uniref:Uncharacterized protein n=1 Tax=Monosporascus ibericus TaxID=155417 RepID=A0A4Q4T381_9PEZI|nr:hypothetical protein DL764_007134 [Monosporascus ibericus]